MAMRFNINYRIDVHDISTDATLSLCPGVHYLEDYGLIVDVWSGGVDILDTCDPNYEIEVL